MYQIDLFTPGYANLSLLSPGAAGPIRRASYIPTGEPGEFVEEAMLLDFSGSPAEIEAARSSLENRLNLAREHLRQRTGIRTSLQIIPVEGEPAWNSPLVDGWLTCPGGDRAKGSLGLQFHFRRDNYWEAASEQAVPLTNRGGTRLTGGLTVWNHRDGGAGHDHYASIEGADIAGDLPAALRMEVFDLSGASPGNEDLLVAQSTFTDPPTLQTVLECGGSSSALCSNGDYTAITVGLEDKLIEKTLDAAFVRGANGGFFKTLLKLKDSIAATDLWLKIRLVDGAGQIFQDCTYGLLPASENVVELGSLQIPPHLAGTGLDSFGTLKIEIWGKKVSGSQTMNVDYILFAPLDGFRRYETLPNANWQNAFLVDDGFTGLVYRKDAAGLNILPAFNVYGDPLRLIPGLNTCFIFQLAGTNISQIDRQMRTRFWYKPRKRMP